MHLTDRQLLDLNEQANRHLFQCAECQQRLNNLEKCRARLHLETRVEMPKKALHMGYFKAQALAHKKAQDARRRRKTAFISGLSLAASVLLTLQLWPGLSQKEPALMETELESLITSNQRLTRQLYAESNNKASGAALAVTRRQADRLDHEIQNAYLDNAADEQIKKLWQKKIIVVSQGLKKDNEHFLSI